MKTNFRHCVLLVLLATAVEREARAQTSYPMLMSAKPVAVQAGLTSEVEIASRYNLHGAYQVLISGEGVTGEAVLPEIKADQPKPNLQSLKLKFTVAADAATGVRDFRVATPQGVSTLGQIVVVRDPVVFEKGANNALADANAVTLPATICGAIEANEDVDFFKFHLDAPTALTFHVQSSRLQDKIHDLQTHSDPIIAVRNSTGTILAQVDNYFFADPLLHHRFESPGDYFLEVRDVRYQGNQYWQYSIEVSDRPFVTNVYPLGVAPAAETRLELIGFHLPSEPITKLTLPAEQTGPQRLSIPMGEILTNPAPLVVSRLPVQVESAEENNSPTQAMVIDDVPAAINGRIEQPADVDCYAIEAKKGEAYSFEVFARRQQSSLDSVLRILNSEGKQLLENDDLSLGRHSSADSWIENWTAPADGKYILEIRDLHLRGGASFVYLLEVSRSQPYFTLDIDTDKTILSAGGSAAIFVRATRKNGFAGEIQLSIEGLPVGVTATCGRILPEGRDGCIVLTADKEARPAAANVRIRGTGQHAMADQSVISLSTTAQPMQEIYMPGGGRSHFPSDMHTVCVAEPLDITSVAVSTTEITLKPGESQKIEVTITRSPGFDKNVTLDCVYQHLGSMFGDSLPKGVTVDLKNSKTLLTGSQTQGHLTLVAAKDAKPAEKQQIAVMAHVSINFVMKMSYASPPVVVTVAP